MIQKKRPEIVPVSAFQPDHAIIKRAAAMIRSGGLVAFPTETVYGLGANAFDPAAVERIFRAKGRPSSDPLIVHLSSASDLHRAAIEAPAVALNLAEHFWPGPLTLILGRNPAVPPVVSSGLPTVAVRVPDHPVALALLRAADLPIAAPSANRFSCPSATSARDVIDDLGNAVDFILDAGPTRIGVESTILDLTQHPPVILRPGGVSLESLQRLLPEVSLETRFLREDSPNIIAPGLLSRHYSPRAQLFLFRGDLAHVLPAMHDHIRLHNREGHSVGLLIPDHEQSEFSDLSVIFPKLGSDLGQISHNLFAAMRELDREGVDVILAHDLGQAGIGLALWDRLVRAAEGQVIDCDLGESD